MMRTRWTVAAFRAVVLVLAGMCGFILAYCITYP